MHIQDLFPLGGRVIVCGPNWLGDCVMSMPAIQVFKHRMPDSRITMLAKPRVAPLWRMHSCVDKVIELNEGLPGALAAAMDVRDRQPDVAFILPNSFRSALIPFLGRVRVRVGARADFRSWMITDVVDTHPEDLLHLHQMWEYFRIFGLDAEEGKDVVPLIHVPRVVVDEVRARFRLGAEERWIGLIPGAARGPSKRWPADYFAEVGRSISKSTGCGVFVFGTADEKDLGGEISVAIGDKAFDLTGRTSIPDLVVLLGLCRLVVTNDCGGMHLAAAAGARVVAVFGLTDPARTGPIGPNHVVLNAEGVQQCRDIPRDSQEARDVMRTIVPERVLNAAEKLLEGWA